MYKIATNVNFLKKFLSHKNVSKFYSVSCDLSAAPAPGQSAGPGTRLALTEMD
jgi:hypothetical protein